MTVKNKEAEAQRAQLAALGRIEQKLDCMDTRLDCMERRATVAGGVAGGMAGGVAGGMVSVAILYIKAKMGW